MIEQFLNDEDLYQDTTIIINKKKAFLYPQVAFQISTSFKKFKINDDTRKTLDFIFKFHFGAQAYVCPEYLKVTTKDHGARFATKFIISVKDFKLNRYRIFVPVFVVELFE